MTDTKREQKKENDEKNINKNKLENKIENKSEKKKNDFVFGHIQLDPSQVFYVSSECYATVNIKPVVPGHALVISKRKVERVKDLNEKELSDIIVTSQRVSIMLESIFTSQAFTFAIQDGALAGQTVKHVHVHVLPRRKGDFDPNDKIYNELEAAKLDLDDNKKPRTAKEMVEEADRFREAMKKLNC